MRTLLVATMRNEGPFIPEWVAWHRLIGFTDLVICSNDCIDGSSALLDRLAERRLLTHLPCRPGPADQPQLFAYAAAETLLPSIRPDWTMVLDADEFMNIHVGRGQIEDLVNAVPDATAFLLNWRVFGDSGFRRWSPEPVTQRFTRAAEQENAVNLSFKTLFSRCDAYHCPLLPHGPGHARPERLRELAPVDGAGARLPERYARSEGFLQSEPGRVSWRLAQVNHYNTRSFEDYLVKHDRGGGLSWDRWELEPNWAAFNRNEAEDLSMTRHAQALAGAIAEVLADPVTADLHSRSCALYDAHVAALQQAAA